MCRHAPLADVRAASWAYVVHPSVPQATAAAGEGRTGVSAALTVGVRVGMTTAGATAGAGVGAHPKAHAEIHHA
jgi:hypothetical protein